MEFLFVKFEEVRDVIIDGGRQGKTNEILELEAGTYTVTLNTPPQDFSPGDVKIVLKDTNAFAPMEVRFEKV